MALTEKSTINRVRELTGLSASALPPTRVLGLMRDARVELARKYPRLLRKTYSTISATSGTADLSSPLGDTDQLFVEMIGSADIFASGITPKLQYLPDLSLLNEERSPHFGFYTLVGDEIRIRANNSDYSGTLTLTGTYIPSLSSITKLELEQAYIQIIASWILGTELSKVKANAATVTTQ